MAYQMKDMSGALFANENKNPQDPNDRRPHFKGKVMVNGQIYEAACWWRTREGAQPYLSINIELPRVPQGGYQQNPPQGGYQQNPPQAAPQNQQYPQQYQPQAPAPQQYRQVQTYQQAAQPQQPRGGQMPPQYQQPAAPPRYQQAPAAPNPNSLEPQEDDLPFQD